MLTETLKIKEQRPTPIESDDETRQRIETDFVLLGIKCPPAILDRCFFLEKRSKFYKDSQMIQEGVENVLLELERKNDKFKLTTEQRKEAILAALVHDIGKSGPSEKPASQLAVVRLFSLENIPKNETNQTVEKTIQKDKKGLGLEIDSMTENLREAGVTPYMPMLAFWNKHAVWTKQILNEYPTVFNENVRKIAGSHHLDKGVDPCEIKESEITDELKYCIYMLMAIDKYQAILFRNGKKTHEEVMKILKSDLEGYQGNSIMDSIIQIIDDLGKAGKLFTKTERG